MAPRARGIASTLYGPYFDSFDLRTHRDVRNSWTDIRLVWRAQHLIEVDRAEDEVRYSRALEHELESILHVYRAVH
jgi:hypothetical protein